jgi:hypothetical protein
MEPCPTIDKERKKVVANMLATTFYEQNIYLLRTFNKLSTAFFAVLL